MPEPRRYPFDLLPRLTRAGARLASEQARASRPLAIGDRTAALADARAVLGAEVTLTPVGVAVVPSARAASSLGASVGVLVALGAHTGLAVLAPGIARVIADRVVGGAGADVALGATPLSRGEAGLVAYVVGRALTHLRRPVASVVDAGVARDVLTGWGEEACVVRTFELGVGEARGVVAFVLPVTAAAALTPRARLEGTFPVRASLQIGSARLQVADVRTLRRGDVVVPDDLTIDPRLADVGRARLVIGRSARTFDLELANGAWRVVRAASIPAPRAPSRWRRRKDPSMSQPDTDTLEALSDVEVELSIELARLEMPVTEVAQLAPGVVVTTGRLVGERVALRAGDRVIAWGELVDVEGEVAVRLTEVPTA